MRGNLSREYSDLLKSAYLTHALSVHNANPSTLISPALDLKCKTCSLLCQLACLFALTPSIKNTNMKVVIVGAGLSGLSCAAELISRGVKVFILEASPRIGGRVLSVELGGESVELGAQWIHGEEGNVVFDIAQKMGAYDMNAFFTPKCTPF